MVIRCLMLIVVVMAVGFASACTTESKVRDYFADRRITQSELNIACRYLWTNDWHYYDALDVAEQVAEVALPDQGPSRIALVMGHFENVIFEFVLPEGFVDKHIDKPLQTYKDTIAAEANEFLADFCYGYLPFFRADIQ